MNDNETCYIYQPNNKSKRRQKEANNVADSSSSKSLLIRQELSRDLWNIQRDGIQKVLNQVNSVTLNEITQFIDDDGTVQSEHLIPTGYVLAGPDTTSHTAFFHQLGSRLVDKVFVSLSASECPNLKTALKTIIQKAIGDEDGDGQTRVKYLDYDLERLHLWFKRSCQKLLVLAFEDSEAFQSSVLADVVDQISAWFNRIPTVLIFGIATSIHVFQERLPQTTLLGLQAHQFNALPSHELLEKIFACTIIGKGIPMVRIGPKLARAIVKRPNEQIQSPQDFIDAFQYAYMCSFYSNPLSIFLNDCLDETEFTTADFDMLRYTESFKRLVQQDMDEELLDSNSALLLAVRQEIQESQNQLDRLCNTLQLIEKMSSTVSLSQLIDRISPNVSFSQLYIMALENELETSTFYREFILMLQKMSSDQFVDLLRKIDGQDTAAKNMFQRRLDDMKLSTTKPLKSKHDMRNQSTMRTTVIAQKVELSIHKTNISEEETNYSAILDDFVQWIDQSVQQSVVSMQNVSFSEVIFYDGTHADNAVFLPRPRRLIERALGHPRDYLGCDCCLQSEAETILSSQPATSLLYQLSQESGVGINVADLWNAFIGVYGGGGTLSSDDNDEAEARFLFQRGLAELCYLGMFKSTRTKTDHIVRVYWQGL